MFMENVRNNKIIKKKYLDFFFSVLISVLILQITTIIDSMIVGTTIGTKEMSGVKASNPIISVVAVFSTLISVGASMINSISLGKRNYTKANITYTYGAFLCIAFGLAFTLIGIFFSDNIVSLLTSNEDVLPFAKTYTKIVLYASPFLILTTYMGYMIRTDGYTKLSMILLISGGIVNVLFDLIFILGFKLGVNGAAYATDMSYIISLLVGMIYLFKKNRNLKFVNIFKKDSGIRNITKEIIKNGFSSASRLLFTSVSLIIANFIVGKYVGYMGLAVFAVISNLALIATAVFQSSGASMMPIMGVFYGEKDYKGIELLLKHVIMFLSILILIVIILIEAFAPFYFPLFGMNNPDTSYVNVLRIYAIGFIGAAFNYILLYYFSTLQKTMLGILVPFLEQIVFSIPAYLLLIPNMGLYGLVLAFIISEFGTTIVTLFIVYLIKKKKGYKSILLLPKENTNLLLDFTVLANEIEAALVSKDVNKILIDNNIDLYKANRVSVILEEMIVNTKEIEKRNKKVYIDIKIVKSENIIISLRSNGYPYDPLTDTVDETSDNLIKGLSINLKHNQIIGFNQTLIEV